MDQSEHNREFIKLRKFYIERRFSFLNPDQLEAVLHTEGALLILAGAGSGKTTALVNRIRLLLEFGDAYSSDYLPRDAQEADIERLGAAVSTGSSELGETAAIMKTGNIQPWNIIAITFTNKAAAQLKSRIMDSAPDASEVFASTFHSACVRFLRRDADRLGWPRNFTIYDADDSLRLMKEIFKSTNTDDRMFEPKKVLGRISRIKDELVSPAEFAKTAGGFYEEKVAELYTEYQRRLKMLGAFDFDDLIYNTVFLFAQNPDVLEYYHRRFRYVMVDEYQDTSYAQYKFVELLSGGYGNLCVVGDDDQSIYRFRGATIENILNFEKAFPGARVIRLEQNYRSTQTILHAANGVIANNVGRKGKTLWTDNDEGALIEVYCAETEQEEAAYIAGQILKNTQAGAPLKSHAVLYRMNAQSNAIEGYFSRAGIPYRVVGGVRFYDRAEIKDIIAYLAILENPADDIRLMRVINKPARKIGPTAVAAVAAVAEGLGLPMLEVVKDAESYPSLARYTAPLAAFYGIYERMLAAKESESLFDFVHFVIAESGYRDWLINQGDEGLTRLENVNELLSNVKLYEQSAEQPELGEFLESVALIADIDRYDEDADAIVLMTLHSAKGLEFDYVFMAGLEEGIFPSEMARYSEQDIEEERRLAYVGITRAKKQLYVSRAEARLLFGSTRRNAASRFLGEIGEQYKNETGFLGRRAPRKADSRVYDSANSRVSLASRATTAKKPTPKAANAAGFVGVGDRVEHKIFGHGVVLSATPMAGDILLEIDFDTAGLKKTMANYAPLKKLDE